MVVVLLSAGSVSSAGPCILLLRLCSSVSSVGCLFLSLSAISISSVASFLVGVVLVFYFLFVLLMLLSPVRRIIFIVWDKLFSRYLIDGRDILLNLNSGPAADIASPLFLLVGILNHPGLFIIIPLLLIKRGGGGLGGIAGSCWVGGFWWLFLIIVEPIIIAH